VISFTQFLLFAKARGIIATSSARAEPTEEARQKKKGTWNLALE